MNIREQFEEIWPVPEGIRWMPHCGYAPDVGVDADLALDTCVEWDARLDTFTRCQESMGPVLSLVEELVEELENAQDWIANETQSAAVSILLTGAKQIIGRDE